MKKPLVSIIVCSYNQGLYLPQALDSVFNQTYDNIQVIAVDDGSQDGSSEILMRYQKEGKPLQVLLMGKNGGYCRAFNKGWALANGQYIIDLSADDMLMPNRVEIGVRALNGSAPAVHFCDAYIMNERSQIKGTHYRRSGSGDLIETVAAGDVYLEILQRYFICAPTMMIHNEVLKATGGYDEDLYYEDFDFWVRSAREFPYWFTDAPLVKKRVLPGSMSKAQYTPDSPMLAATARVCAKAYHLNRSQPENKALAIRLRYELRQAILCNNYQVAESLHGLLGKMAPEKWDFRFWTWLVARQWNISFLSRFIGKAR